MRIFVGITGIIAALAASTPAKAEYPEKQITVINPYSAGGGTDVGLRTWQPYVERCLGSSAVLIPTAMPGAAAAVGITALWKSAPDGYTVGMANMPNLVTNKFAKPEQPSFEDFVWLGNIIGVNSTINVQKSSRFKDLKEAVEYIKSSPTPVNIAMGGVGADDHLAGLQMQKLLGVKVNFIPFGSGAESRNALLGGQVEFAMMSNVESAGFKEEIRPLAVASAERIELLPDTPTFREQGVDLIGGSTHVIGMPKGAPEEAVAKWRECIQTAGKDPKFIEDATKRSLSLNVMTGEQTEQFIREQAKVLLELWKSDPWIK